MAALEGAPSVSVPRDFSGSSPDSVCLSSCVCMSTWVLLNALCGTLLSARSGGSAYRQPGLQAGLLNGAVSSPANKNMGPPLLLLATTSRLA